MECGDVACWTLGGIVHGAQRRGGLADPESQVVGIDGLQMDRACGVNSDQGERLVNRKLALHDRLGTGS